MFGAFRCVSNFLVCVNGGHKLQSRCEPVDAGANEALNLQNRLRCSLSQQCPESQVTRKTASSISFVAARSTFFVIGDFYDTCPDHHHSIPLRRDTQARLVSWKCGLIMAKCRADPLIVMGPARTCATECQITHRTPRNKHRRPLWLRASSNGTTRSSAAKKNFLAAFHSQWIFCSVLSPNEQLIAFVFKQALRSHSKTASKVDYRSSP